MSLLSKLFGRGTGDTMQPPAPLGRDQFADHYVAMLAEKAPDLTVERADTGIVSAPKYRFKVLTARSGCASARSSGRSAPRWASRSSTARYRRIMSTCSSRCRPILPSATSCAGQRAARHAKSSVGQGGHADAKLAVECPLRLFETLLRSQRNIILSPQPSGSFAAVVMIRPPGHARACRNCPDCQRRERKGDWNSSCRTQCTEQPGRSGAVQARTSLIASAVASTRKGAEGDPVLA